jgi:CheY-like chemotaxis protein
LTRQLLTFSRRQTFHPTIAILAERVDAFRNMLTTSLGGSIRLTIDIPAETWPVQIDTSEFELALVNLALNARDAMPQQTGVLTISAENVTLSPEQTPAGLQGEFVALSMADTGYGIAPDILPLVFDPFFTTKGPNKGSGLGLSQVHGFAHQSGGTIAITSELGRGTCVTLYLPRAKTDARPRPGHGDNMVEPAKGEIALLVEDNPEVARITEQMIAQLGYRVQRADSAAAALALAERIQFHLVISDIVMAGSMDGVGLVRAIRERHPEVPIVLVTGYSGSAAAAELEFTVLRKPFELSDLSRATARAIAELRADGNVIRLHDRRAGAEQQRVRQDSHRDSHQDSHQDPRRDGGDDPGDDVPA